MALSLKKTVVMVGMMGAGKTAIGRAVADELAVPFLDSDEEIVRAAQMEIPEIFARDGEGFFRDRETEVITRLLDEGPCILSTGGGAFLAQRNRDVISQKGVSVWLRADLELLWSRVRHKDTRPLLRTPDPKATLTSLHQARVPHYENADMVVDSHEDYSISDMAQRVISGLRKRPDVIENK
ncbi:shikimate kinase [Halocynthiibacter namhaensis]|uniref:shikimate kinase n=1 Tax=Halocynthiibacter namhaensis TaxID=1290553 RepID=UPI0006923D61|nr:shikimate kinase [Halocynthiibacter namhaensis]